MNKEMSKSVVLFLLVALSLLLTYGLWTYQPHNEFVQSTNNIQNVTIGEKRQFNEVIKPIQFIYHKDNQHFGFTNYIENNELYQMVMDLNVTEIKHETFSSDEELNLFLQQNGIVEMIFPVAIPMELSNYIMVPLRQEYEIEYFDRIALSIHKEPALYFVSSKNDSVIKMKIEDKTIDIIKEKILSNNQNYTVYFSIKVRNGELIYLPENPFILDQLTFTTQNIAASEFKNALFTDPNRVKQYSLLNGEESYTDGSKALEITSNQSMLSFVNPAKSETIKMESAEMILKSIEFINDHSGWTDSFSLMNWSKNDQTVTFGLMIKGYPVFNLLDQNRSTSIYQSWRDSEIYEYQRSLINLRFSVENEQKQIKIPSGRELLSYLAQIKPDFNLDLLEKAEIGFDFVIENPNVYEITVQPRWFIKYAGKWEEIFIPSTIIGQGGNDFGVE
ncbi:YycH family regulatory protein [Calidifontibacillus oryziterrae]|uniref:YycH family regulatory protein n=1 Tax=Calidifontibacillus oryziterrae TaxID=1191699 RepID=UPI00031D91BC|nr:two-component system activity regulator YycH [Calidifontibacillus oryziterrae]